MKLLFAPNTMGQSSEVYLLREILDREEIACTIRNEHLAIASGELAPQECLPALWVMNDADYPKAFELVEAWRSSSVETRSQWVCPDCGETIEGQFSSCWQCGKLRVEA
jgi:rubrerythrin